LGKLDPGEEALGGALVVELLELLVLLGRVLMEVEEEELAIADAVLVEEVDELLEAVVDVLEPDVLVEAATNVAVIVSGPSTVGGRRRGMVPKDGVPGVRGPSREAEALAGAGRNRDRRGCVEPVRP